MSFSTPPPPQASEVLGQLMLGREAELEDVSVHIQGFYQLDDRGTLPPTMMIKTANIADYPLSDMI